jgi:Tfp pilus assembly protein PilO
MKSFGFKKKIQISRRENILILILLILVELYFLFYRVLWTRYETLLANKDANLQKEHTISILKNDYDKTPQYREELNGLLETEAQTKLKLPGYTSQEELILLIDSLSKETGLTVMVVSFQSVVTTQQSTYLSGGEAAASDLLVAEQTISLSVNGTFDRIYDFLDKLENNERRAYINGLSLSTDNKGKVGGSMQVKFLSLIDPNNPEAYQMQIDPIVGKKSPFIPYAGYWASAGVEDADEPAILTPDFALYINSYLDNAPGIILTEYKNSSARISDEVNRLANCKITLGTAENGYNYVFELEGKVLESSAALTVKNNEIVIEVISQTRRDEEDLTAATLDVVNKTPLPVRVVVSKDDETNPRFMLGETSGKVSLE